MKIKYKKRGLRYSFLLFLILVIATTIFVILKDINQKPILCEDCNLIIIGIDTLRADRVGYFNYKRDLTPTLDSLAENSYVFKNTIAQASWTLPSFMSLFTSTYPSQNKVKNKYYINAGQIATTNLKKLSPNIKTLADVMKQKGYETAGFTGGAGVSSEFGFALGFDEYYDKDNFSSFNTSFSAAEKWISKNKNKPFFAFIHGYDSHGNFELDYEKRFYSGNGSINYKGTKEEHLVLRERRTKVWSLNLSEEDKVFWENLYDDKVLNMDSQLAEFVQYLNEENIVNKTILVIISDHGDEFLEHGGIDHGMTLYDELLKVVFIIKLPGSDKKILEDQVRLIDVMPTILNLLNIGIDSDLKKQIQGVSLIPLMQGKHLYLDALSETDYRGFVSKKSIRTHDGWKLIIDYLSWEKELYNLAADPDEKNNLVKSEENKVEELSKKLSDQISQEID